MQPNRQFVTVWTAAWLRPAAYRRRRPSGLAGLVQRWVRRDRAKAVGADYFTRLASIPDLPQSHRVRAMAIAMHHRKLAALRQLIVADEA